MDGRHKRMGLLKKRQGVSSGRREIRNLILGLAVSAAAATLLMTGLATAQNAAPAGQGAAGDTTFTPKAEANLLQIMRGVMFPESNVVFAGQNDVSKIAQGP